MFAVSITTTDGVRGFNELIAVMSVVVHHGLSNDFSRASSERQIVYSMLYLVGGGHIVCNTLHVAINMN